MRSFLAATRTLGNLPGPAAGGLVPVNIQYRQAELRHIFQDAGMRLCFPMQSDGQSSSGRGELAQLEVVIGTDNNIGAFLKKGTGALRARR